jgi:hypothetical protein
MSEGGKRSAWMTHVKKTMKAHRGLALRDVLKMAKKTYTGGQLMGKAGPMGGRKHRGGQLYSFAGGPYTDSVLSDGAAPFKFLPDSTWQGPSVLKGGAHHLAPVAKGGQPADVPFTGEPTTMPGGRRRRLRKTRRGGQVMPDEEDPNPGLPDEEAGPDEDPGLPDEEAGPGEGATGGRRRRRRSTRR